MQAVILAGGRGTRLHPLTHDAPKPMVSLFDRPILDHLIRLLACSGISEIGITVSYKADQIIRYCGNGSRWGVHIHYSIEETPRGTAGSLLPFAHCLQEPFLVVSGDAVSDFDLLQALEWHCRQNAVVTMLLSQVDDPSEYGIVEINPQCHVQRFLEKPTRTEIFSNLVNTGLYVLAPYVLRLIPPDRPYDFSRDLFPLLLRQQDPLYGLLMSGYWCDIGNLFSYRQVHFDALSGCVKIEWETPPTDEGMWIHPEASLAKDVALNAPLYIGSHARVERGASLGAYAVVGERTHVESHAMISASIVGARSTVGSQSLLHGCVIGQQTRVEPAREHQQAVLMPNQIQPLFCSSETHAA